MVAGIGRAAEPAPAAQKVDHTLFTTSAHCLACHSNIKTPAGEDVSIGYQWRATIMANSSRDPYWQAGIRREAMDHPNAQGAIEDICSTCHMPMQRFQAHAEGRPGEVFRYLEAIRSGKANIEPEAILADAEDPNANLAADGVSCTLCHQIRPDNFGQEASFDGGFVIDTSKPPETRDIFGPFAMDNGRTRVMHSVTGFMPTQGEHIRQSELCASCHTLFTKALDNEGRPAGILPEQVPYQEWRHSDFAKTDSCQSCHMPKVEGVTNVSSVQGQPHEGVARHVFVGGNAFVLDILDKHRSELGTLAQPAELQAQVKRTESHLAEQTAQIAVKAMRVNAGRVEFDVAVNSLSGHKFPTAYPSRRAWLHVTVKNARNETVFESGAVRPNGSITGNDNDADALKFEPHYTRIDSPGEVQIYESIMGDYAGRVTTGLLYGSHYLKDNRILPRGFNKATADEDIAVVGGAASDADFTGGGDSVAYSVPAKDTGPYTVSAELLYEAIGFRWADNLRAYNAPEPQRFVGYYDKAAQKSAKLVARANATVR